ncbi:MAG TPA: hypothetical protein VKB19_04260 [Pedobacter sp.]|nr:hypothetical protein [Pedobacter sp.]
MSEIKSLADQLRSSLVVPEPISPKTTKPKATTGKAAAGDKGVDLNPKILQEILAYDTAEHKTMVHARFDAKTAKMLGHFKMATGVENTRIAAFAVHYLFSVHPELKSIIKHYIQNLEL